VTLEQTRFDLADPGLLFRDDVIADARRSRVSKRALRSHGCLSAPA